jgi:hypothetical protein
MYVQFSLVRHFQKINSFLLGPITLLALLVFRFSNHLLLYYRLMNYLLTFKSLVLLCTLVASQHTLLTISLSHLELSPDFTLYSEYSNQDALLNPLDKNEMKPETLNSPLFTNDGNPVRLSDLDFEKTVTIT